MKTIAQQLDIKDFPFVIKDKNGKVTYYEDSGGFWSKREYDKNGKETYYEDSTGFWIKREFNKNGKETYYKDSGGYWRKYEYDKNGNRTYSEDSDGLIKDNRSTELTLQEIADKFGIDVKNLRIKD